MSKPKQGKAPKNSMRKLLKRLSEEKEPVTIIISSGTECCEITGCIAKITDDYITLITSSNACRRAYIAIDCICAIIKPAKLPLPPDPPEPDPECECQVTGAANITEPAPPGPPDVVKLTVVACPGCTLHLSHITYTNTFGEEDVNLEVSVPGPDPAPSIGEIESVSCDDGEAATITGTAQIIIGEDDPEICDFILDVTDTPPPTPDTMQMRIICDGVEVHDSGVVELLGQSINIQEC
ncbi:hypothetical protein [Fuchsiella alkaliacetigena]|uniref:hypothetical protein n=1 Tax=Fuchsiella alkaliacetigena TaxID=957042 RepID=UPI00200AD0A7|nr:hypothetical protein [Fuchsiella alkaliacetigena]MCK8826130.1 hypothetical protein [Fuchsiella alkaliacetigena]